MQSSLPDLAAFDPLALAGVAAADEPQFLLLLEPAYIGVGDASFGPS